MPEWKPEILRRFAPLKLSSAREGEITEEIAQHLEDRYNELPVTGSLKTQLSEPPSTN